MGFRFFFSEMDAGLLHVKLLPLYKSMWDFISRSALKRLFCLGVFSYTKSYIILFSEGIAGKSSSAIVVGKSPREVTRASWLEAFHIDIEKKPSGKCLPLLSPTALLDSWPCIPTNSSLHIRHMKYLE